VIAQAPIESGLPGDWLLDGVQAPAVKQPFLANQESAVERGVFGSPSFFVGEEL